MKKVGFLVLVSMLAALVMSSCGKVNNAADQTRGELELPEHEGRTTPFFLNSDAQRLEYSGSIIIWNEKVQSAQIQRIAKASINGRNLRTETLQFKDAHLKPAKIDVEIKSKAVTDAETAIADAKKEGRENGDLVTSLQKPIVADWFATRLGELEKTGKISAEDKAHAQTYWQAYCDYKVWELAISPQLQLDFELRPSPLWMCENYYEERGYFQGEMCESSKDGKNYFDCIWQQGVLLTQTFAEELETAACYRRQGPDTYPNRAEAIRTWLTDENQILKKALFNEDIGETIAGFIFNGKTILKRVREHEIDGEMPFQDFENCRYAFKRDFVEVALEGEGEEGAIDWRLAPLNELKNIGEITREGISATLFQLLPATGDTTLDQENLDKLAQYIRLFGERVQAWESSEERGVDLYKASVSDAMFHRVAGQTLEAKPDNTEGVKQDEAFAEVFDLDEKLVPQKLKDALKDRQQELKDSQAALHEQLLVFDQWKTKLKNNVGESIAAVGDDGATIFFKKYGLQLNRVDNHMAVYFQMEGASKFYLGCIGLDGEISDACTISDEASQLAGAEISYAEGAGKLTMTLPIADLSHLGMASLPRSSESIYFNEIAEAELIGRSLKLELFSNRLDDTLDFFTGTVHIMDGERKVFAGSSSGDNFGQQIAQ